MSDAMPPPPPDAPDTPEERQHKLFELLAAILLGIGALATAWSAYQSGKLGGDELAAFTTSNQALADANFFYSQGGSQLDADNALFVQYAVAVTEANEPLAEYVRTSLMSTNLQEAMAWWESTDDAVTPFDAIEGNPYVIEAYTQADELQTTAEEKLQEAEEVGGRGDQYDLASVLLAVSLFFAGITIVFDRKGVIVTLLAIGAIILVYGLIVMFTA